MKKRKTRFDAGGLNPYQGDDVDYFENARNEVGGTDPRAEGPSSESLIDETTGKELSTRRSLETGDYYSTEPVKPPKKATRAAPKVSSNKDVPSDGRSRTASYSNEGRNKPTPASTSKVSKPQYPTAAERFAEIKSAFKKRFGTQSMREANYAEGGKVSASSRADGIAIRGKTRGKVY